MAKTPAEFQTLQQIAETADALSELADRAQSLVKSLRAVQSEGAKIVGHKAKETGLKSIEAWLNSGFLKVRDRTKQNADFGITPTEDPITANNRKRKRQPDSSGKNA